MRTISSREFNQDIAAAKRAAKHQPVCITDRGTPAHVLMSIDEYRRLTHNNASLSTLLDNPASYDIELPLETRTGRSLNIPELD